MDDKSKKIIRQDVHKFLQNVAVGMQNIPKEFEENKKYLFVFLDHLGFSNKVLKATEDYGWLSFCADMEIFINDNLKRLLNKCQQWNTNVSLVRVKRFSDSICLFWEIGDYEEDRNYYDSAELAQLLGEVFFLVANIQMNASINNALFRGGIAVGHYFEYNDVTVSDALVRAHNIENTIKIPVVGIDETVWKELGDEDIHKWYLNEKYLSNYSGKVNFEYIDFINVVLKNEKVSELKLEGIYFDNMKKAILSNWESAKSTIIDNTINPSLKRKYEWLFEYYNGKCVEKNQLKYIIEDKDVEELMSLNT